MRLKPSKNVTLGGREKKGKREGGKERVPVNIPQYLSKSEYLKTTKCMKIHHKFRKQDQKTEKRIFQEIRKGKDFQKQKESGRTNQREIRTKEEDVGSDRY